ncbi:aminoglycoside phosphotransferase family protein [Streptomyces avicenniae]|uniref:aminoglycoside phosphotransferase family protein n=1 Tax=Streptomyces avicenniae TaxID=500153 RepID=UPI00069C2D10|nr:aminoglycoside phosphotransferase family protein [Streptomyces avicenniae]
MAHSLSANRAPPYAGAVITVPPRLAAHHAAFSGDAGRAWTAALPALADRMLAEWRLRPTGPAMHGMVALVLPVTTGDGIPAVLKLQPPDEETEGEPSALAAWDGDGAVRLLAHHPGTGSMLLERLSQRSLADVADAREAVTLLTGLLARLTAATPPPGLRQLRDLADAMLARVPTALRDADPVCRPLLRDCAAAVREVRDEPGDRLLHWDLHYENVLAPLLGSGREPWLAIDPKPLVGDPCFDLAPALHNRWTPDGTRARFDLMTGLLGVDRARARAWTLGRVLQNALWSVASGAGGPSPEQTGIYAALR